MKGFYDRSIVCFEKQKISCVAWISETKDNATRVIILIGSLVVLYVERI